MKGTLKFLMLSCKRAAILMDKKTEVQLSMRQNLQLHFHTKICNSCAYYQKQSNFIHNILNHKMALDLNESSNVIENPELKNRIIQKIM